MAGLNFPHGIAQALWAGKLFHIDLNGQSGIKYDQDLRFGAGDLRSAFWLVDLLETAGYDGPAALRLQAAADRGLRRRVGVGRGLHAQLPASCKERAAAFRADPEVQEALRASRLDELAQPDGGGRPGGPARGPRRPSRSSTREAAAARGMAFEQLDQLAMDHLLGARG